MRYTTHAQAAFFHSSPPPALVLSLLWGGARACALIIPKSQGSPRKCSKAVPCRQSGSGSLLVAPSPAANLSGKNSGSAAPVLPVAHPGDRSVTALEPLKDVHVGLAPPCQDPGRLALLSGHYLYYHYGCDGLDDRGWGCGYRTLQTLCSWPQGQSSGVPGLAAVQAALEDMGDKTSGFRDSRSWIGCVEASLCLQHFGGPQGRLRHVPRGTGLWEELKHLYSHFAGGGGPVMVGGDADAQSKALLGVCTGPEAYVLVLDPHYWGTPKNPSELQDAGWVSWRKVSTVFDSNSFYNLCLTSRT